ncbi:hypothetical protein JCM11641_007839 [Rhodosporidiobolus odoratus]
MSSTTSRTHRPSPVIPTQYNAKKLRHLDSPVKDLLWRASALFGGSRSVAPVAVGSKKVKKSADNINARLALVIKSGKYSLGYKSTVKAMRSGKSKLVLISGNTPPLRRSELEYYAMLSKTPVHLYQGSNVALGTAAGKLFRVGVMSIENAGDSDLLSVTSQ